jgi:fibronectin-binding autotransporter adhesin
VPFVYSVRGQHNNPKKVESDSAIDYLTVSGGDKIFTAGGYVIHCFLQTGVSELKINTVSNNLPSKVTSLLNQGLEVEYLVVGGGGAGGSRHGGGGGAGGMVVGSGALGIGPNAVSVGLGGASITGDSTGNPGGNSSLTPLIIARGGGGGGSWGPGGNANSGGSGGGSSGPSVGISGVAQAPTSVLPASQSFGNPGGSSTVWGNPIGYLRVGGGGGAGTPGTSAELVGPNGAGFNARGGDGKLSSILGSEYYWAGGGGGAAWAERGGQGGIGGGGGGTGNPAGTGGPGLNTGGTSDAETGGTDGVGGSAGANTGGGGGGGQQVPSTGGAGGPGIVVVRYRR